MLDDLSPVSDTHPSQALHLTSDTEPFLQSTLKKSIENQLNELFQCYKELNDSDKELANDRIHQVCRSLSL